MKKNVFAAIFAVVIVAVLAACGNVSSSKQVTEEKVNGTAYSITSTTDETGNTVYGVKRGEEQVFSNLYSSMRYIQGYFIAEYHEVVAGVQLDGESLLDPQSGEIITSSDSISFNEKEKCFIGKSKLSGSTLFYPESKSLFSALRGYVISGDIVLARAYDGWGAFTNKAPNDTIIAPNQYEKIVLLNKTKEFLVPYEKGKWLKLNENDEGIEIISEARLKRMKGWQEDSEAFVIE